MVRGGDGWQKTRHSTRQICPGIGNQHFNRHAVTVIPVGAVSKSVESVRGDPVSKSMGGTECEVSFAADRRS